jgi:hypothetical protein
MTCDLVSAFGIVSNTQKLIETPITQERPCTRCVKRNIGHLCHDEPREGVKKSKSEPEHTPGDSETPKNGTHPSDAALDPVPQEPNAPDAGLNLAPPPLPDRGPSTTSVTEPDPVSAPQLPSLSSGNQSCELHLLSAPTYACH